MFFKKKKNKEDNICRFCIYATLTDNDDKIICSTHGEVGSHFTCRKFSYDLLKREPAKFRKLEPIEYVDIND